MPFPDGTETLGDIPVAAQFFDKGGAVYNVMHPDVGATGDGATDDTAAIQAALDTLDTIGGGTLVFPPGEYLVSDELSVTSVRIVCEGEVKIRRTDSVDNEYILKVEGSVGSFHDLDSNATKGNNFIVSSALVAAGVSVGDLLQIKSSAVFISSESIVQGELATVKLINGNTVYLNETYTTANNADVAIVSPSMFDVQGKLILENTPSTVNSLPRGLLVTYCMSPSGDIEFRNCQGDSLVIFSSYAPVFNVTALRTAEEDPGESGGNGYGISVANSVMYGQFTGIISFCRHAVSIGGATAFYGVSWENEFRGITGIGGGGSSVFDAHGPAGSVRYVDCVSIGGTISDPVASDAAPSGFQLGARYSYIKNCRVVRARNGVGIRDDGQTMEVLSIDGLECVEITEHCVVPNPGSAATINNLFVRNVVADAMQGAGFYGVALGGNLTIGESWLFDGIHVINAGLLSAGHAAGPDTLRLTNCSTVGSSVVSQDLSFRGVSVGSSDLIELHLIGCRFEEIPTGVRVMGSATGLTTLKILNCLFDGNFNHIFFSIAGPNDIRVVGSDFLNAANGSSVAGVINADVMNTFTILEVIGCRIDTDGFFIGDLGGATTVINTGNNTPTGFRMERQNNANVIELLGGQLNGIGYYRGTGTPERKVTAPVGSTYSRDDGGANTSFYVKESGTGNTGWAAK